MRITLKKKIIDNISFIGELELTEVNKLQDMIHNQLNKMQTMNLIVYSISTDIWLFCWLIKLYDYRLNSIGR